MLTDNTKWTSIPIEEANEAREKREYDMISFEIPLVR